MQSNGNKEKIEIFLSQYIQNEKMNDDEDIFRSGVINSLFALQLVMFVEKEFEITVENEDLDLKNFNTVNAIVRFVDRKTH